MALPPLYKYLSVRGAKLTLRNGKFKHAKPSDFNDVEDLTIQSIFADEIEIALTKLSNGFIDVILQHLNEQPTCSSPMRERIAILQHAFRQNPNAGEILKAEGGGEGDEPIFDVEHMRAVSQAFIMEINDFMQNYRILCVTIHRDSERMWTDYAENHEGVMMRIEPNISKDSMFQSFRPVEYREMRPPLYDDPLDYIAGSLFGDQVAQRREIIERIVYTKTLQWQHEAEYRLAIALLQGERPWDVLPYHPEEITELYLGHAMTKEDKEDITSMAKERNPEIAIFQVGRDAKTKLTFNPI